MGGNFIYGKALCTALTGKLSSKKRGGGGEGIFPSSNHNVIDLIDSLSLFISIFLIRERNNTLRVGLSAISYSLSKSFNAVKINSLSISIVGELFLIQTLYSSILFSSSSLSPTV